MNTTDFYPSWFKCPAKFNGFGHFVGQFDLTILSGIKGTSDTTDSDRRQVRSRPSITYHSNFKSKMAAYQGFAAFNTLPCVNLLGAREITSFGLVEKKSDSAGPRGPK